MTIVVPVNTTPTTNRSQNNCVDSIRTICRTTSPAAPWGEKDEEEEEECFPSWDVTENVPPVLYDLWLEDTDADDPSSWLGKPISIESSSSLYLPLTIATFQLINQGLFFRGMVEVFVDSFFWS